MRRPQFSLKRLLWVMATVSIFLALTVHGTIVRARFAMSRAAVNTLARALDDGERPVLPCRAGLFRIYEIETSPGGVIKLWTGGDSSGRAGLARGIQPNDPRYWSQSRLDKDWWYVVED